LKEWARDFPVALRDEEDPRPDPNESRKARLASRHAGSLARYGQPLIPSKDTDSLAADSWAEKVPGESPTALD